MLEQRATRAGFVLALFSAATFGTSGTFARSLIDTGWSPAAAVAIRISIAAVLLAVPAVVTLRGRWNVLWRNIRMVTIYGLVAIAGCQVFFFNAVQHLSVGVALLLEYMGIILIVGWLWIRNGQRPRRLTIAGSVAAVLGLILVLNLVGDTHIDLVGVRWGLAAAVGLAVFFVLSAKRDPDLPPLAMASGGRSGSLLADSTKNTASPTAAARPQSTPTRSICVSPTRLSTRIRPSTAATDPAMVSRRGRCPLRIHSQPTIRMMPMYSSSRATPTDRCCTALKKNTWQPAIATSP